MSPALASLILTVVSLPIVAVYYVFPALNLHIRMNQEALFKQKMMNIITETRHNDTLLRDELQKTNPKLNSIKGIDLENINVIPEGQYYRVLVDYKSKAALFTGGGGSQPPSNPPDDSSAYGEAASPAIPAKDKDKFTMEFLIDRV